MEGGREGKAGHDGGKEREGGRERGAPIEKGEKAKRPGARETKCRVVPLRGKVTTTTPNTQGDLWFLASL